MEDLIHSLLFSFDTLINSISKRPYLYFQNQTILDYDFEDLVLERTIQEDAVCSYNSDSD